MAKLDSLIKVANIRDFFTGVGTLKDSVTSVGKAINQKYEIPKARELESLKSKNFLKGLLIGGLGVGVLGGTTMIVKKFLNDRKKERQMLNTLLLSQQSNKEAALLKAASFGMVMTNAGRKVVNQGNFLSNIINKVKGFGKNLNNTKSPNITNAFTKQTKFTGRGLNIATKSQPMNVQKTVNNIKQKFQQPINPTETTQAAMTQGRKVKAVKNKPTKAIKEQTPAEIKPKSNLNRNLTYGAIGVGGVALGTGLGYNMNKQPEQNQYM